jgi:hypothetical protein
MAETLTTPVTRLEKGMIRVQNALGHLAEIQRRQIESSTALEKRMAAREKRMDERIEKLVSAIGAFIARVDKQVDKR